MNASFLVPYHPNRIENLNQTIRFLTKREPELKNKSELILICNTNYNYLEKPFIDTLTINMNLINYSRPIMINYGASIAKHEILIILDSDRILPNNYFTKILKKIKKREVFTAKKIIKLRKEYSDESIESMEIESDKDCRSVENEMKRKNLFAGNTVIFKKDFLNIGGFDEEYIGYGFSDTDITKKAEKDGLKQIFLEDTEIHLFHEKEIMWNGKIIKDDCFKVLTAINGIRYCRKWSLKPEERLRNLILEINNINHLPDDLKILWSKNKTKIIL
jgi:predicted glycosyltransferase involved in capsule biosynthesis